MARRQRSPEEDRANAPLIVMFDSVVTPIGVGGFVVALLTDSLAETGRRGWPMWLVMPLGALFGGSLIWVGVQMRTRGRAASE